MSAPRQGFRLFSLWLALILTVLCVTPVLSSLSAPIVTDPQTGLAIDGFDPVAYFTAEGPAQGKPDLEYQLAGVIWRFRNEGNRASFLAHPEVYGPQFGGYDPTDVARGLTVAGNPRLFAVIEERLFLFSREESRDAFTADPARYLPRAEARWPALEQDLSQ